MGEPAKTFQDLGVWQKAHKFVISIYCITEDFPAHERYGVTSQMRRAAVSIPANIAEGFRKRSKADKARMMNIAQGPLEEARYYLILSRDLNYADVAVPMLLIEEVGRMLDAYIKAMLSSNS